MASQSQKPPASGSVVQTLPNNQQPGQSLVPGGQSKPRQASNIPPPWEKFETAEESKKKQIYNTMLEQIKQVQICYHKKYMRANEELIKAHANHPGAEELLKLRQENERLKAEILAGGGSNLKDIQKKVEEDEKSIIIFQEKDGVKTDPEMVKLNQAFQRDRESLLQKQKLERENYEKRITEMQKMVATQHTTIQGLQQKQLQMQQQLQQQLQSNHPTSQHPASQHPSSQHQIKFETSKADQEKINSLERSNLELKMDLQQSKDDVKKLQTQLSQMKVKEEQIQILEAQAKMLTQSNAELQIKLNQVQILPSEIKVDKNEWERLQNQKQNQEADFKRLRDDIESHQVSQQFLHKHEIMRLSNEVKNLQNQNQGLNHSLMQQQDKFQKMEHELETIKKKHKSVKSQSLQMQSKIKEQSLAMEDLIGENSRLILDAFNQMK